MQPHVQTAFVADMVINRWVRELLGTGRDEVSAAVMKSHGRPFTEDGTPRFNSLHFSGSTEKVMVRRLALNARCLSLPSNRRQRRSASSRMLWMAAISSRSASVR